MNKTYKWISFAILCASLVLASLLPIAFKNEFLSTNKSYLGVYVSSKVLFGLLGIAGIFSLLFLKMAHGMGLFTTIGASIIQIVPLFIRLILKNAVEKNNTTNSPIIYSVVLIVIAILITIIPTIVLNSMNRKMTRSDDKFQADEIPLEEEGEKHE